MKGPAVPDLVHTPSEAFHGKDPPRPRCVACRADHGAIGVHLLCLSEEVTRLRRKLAGLRCARCLLNGYHCTCDGGPT